MSLPYGKVPSMAVKQPTPYGISIPESKLSELALLLKLSKIASPTYESLQEDGRFGITSDWLTNAKEYWESNFDWRTHERHFNSFPNFTTKIVHGDELFDIHFVALFSERVDPPPIPIILLHGWPGSFLEFLPILSMMRAKYTPETLPYHLIVPSLPGYAFSSSPPLHNEFGLRDVAYLMNDLMIQLGFDSGYVAQGGDIGSRLARIMAVEYKSCKAAHINYCNMPEPTLARGERLPVDAAEIKGLVRGEDFIETGYAYDLEHATRPSTIGFVLASNPLSLLAWIGEKFLEWSDETLPLDVILESVTLYWVTETFPRSIYPYRQRFAPGNIGAHEARDNYIKKPLGYSWFPKDVPPIPRSWVERTGNLVFFRQHSKGGHFAALEQPSTFMQDLEEFIQQVWE